MKLDRNEWLNKPADQNITTEELQELIGQYIVEAMILIEEDNLRRQAIVHDATATEEEKQSALLNGVWYPEDYCEALKDTPYKERFEWMQKRGSFLHGLMSPKLWSQSDKHQSPSGKEFVFQWKKGAVSPAETLADILEGKSLCLLECATVVNIAHYAALLRVWGKERFDRCFSGEAPLTLSWCISHYATINPIYLFLEGIQTNDTTQILLGDKIGIRTHPAYPLKHPFGTATGWNLICSNENAERKFVGFGMSATGLTEHEISQALIAEYNEESSFNGDVAQGVILKNAKAHYDLCVSNFSRSGAPQQLTQMEFEKVKGGLNGQIVRLNAKKVRMVFLQEEEKANLFDVFKETVSGAKKYAMDSGTLKLWTAYQARQKALGNRKEKATGQTADLKK